MLEYLAHPRISVIHIFNLPLTTQKTVVDGQLREEFVAPSVALGARVTALSFEVFAESHLELQFAALAGFTLGSRSGDVVFHWRPVGSTSRMEVVSPSTSGRPSLSARIRWPCSTASGIGFELRTAPARHAWGSLVKMANRQDAAGAKGLPCASGRLPNRSWSFGVCGVLAVQPKLRQCSAGHHRTQAGPYRAPHQPPSLRRPTCGIFDSTIPC